MPANRITALLRSIADYRVEACFLAALAFTLGHNAFHDRPFHVRTTAHETVVHEVRPARVSAAHRPVHVIERPGGVGVAVPAPRAHAGSNGRIVIKRDSDAALPCATSPALAAARVAEGATCKIVRVAPSAGVAVAKAFARGG